MTSAYSRLPSSTPGMIDLDCSIDAGLAIMVGNLFMNMSVSDDARKTRREVPASFFGSQVGLEICGLGRAARWRERHGIFDLPDRLFGASAVQSGREKYSALSRAKITSMSSAVPPR